MNFNCENIAYFQDVKIFTTKRELPTLLTFWNMSKKVVTPGNVFFYSFLSFLHFNTSMNMHMNNVAMLTTWHCDREAKKTFFVYILARHLIAYVN